LNKAHSLVRELLTAACALLQWAYQPDSVFAAPLDFPPKLHDICLSSRNKTVQTLRDFFRSVSRLFQFLKSCEAEWEETVKAGIPVTWCQVTGASVHCWTANFATHILQAVREGAGVEGFRVTEDGLPEEQMQGLLNRWDDIREMLRLVEVPNHRMVEEYLISEYYKAQDRQSNGNKNCRNGVGQDAPIKPRWDSNRRELWYSGQLCRQYKRPAPNRELVLKSFEELSWPERIDDPLPRGTLADTIKDLQDDLRNTPIIIERDGTGKGICWRKRNSP
jgi:hypothetical protein